MQQNVALIGKSGVGKSAVANILVERFGLEHVRTGRTCRLIAQLLFGDETKAHTQSLDDALTAIDPSIFLRAALRATKPGQPIVVDSLRFNTDLILARQIGCVVIRVTAPEEIRLARLRARGQVFDPAVDGVHRSELELEQALVDYEIANSGSTRELADRFSELFGSK